MNLKAEHFLATQNRLGEGAVWNDEEQALYWVDIESNTFHRWDYQTNEQKTFDTGLMVGCIRFRAKGGLIMATQNGFAFWDFQANRLVPGPDPVKNPAMRFNDGNVDSEGRFWAGSMYFDNEVDKREGSLYRLDPDGSVHIMATHQAIPNGLGWSPDLKTLYHADTPRKVIYAYDYDAATGHIENRRKFIYTPDDEGMPDGLTVDSEGFIWSCRWEGWKVTRYDPDGKVDREVHVNAAHVTSCAFGGPDLDELFITTAWVGLTDDQRRQQPQAGDIFRLKAGVKGQSTHKFAG
jgi:sugar lactone lactonase YvrE